MEGETCDFCLEGSLERHLVREYYRVKKGLVVMENVPAYVCDRCGERYYDSQSSGAGTDGVDRKLIASTYVC